VSIFIPKLRLILILNSFLGSRSEERFSRNAETDLVCRLLLEKKKILSFRMQGDECDNGDIYVDGHKADSDVRDEFVSVTDKLIDALAQCYNVLPHLYIFFTIAPSTEVYTLSLHDALPICEHFHPEVAAHSDSEQLLGK